MERPVRSGAVPHALRGREHRLDDRLVTGAAAEIAGEGVAHVGLGRRGHAVEQLDGGEDHARRAVAALERMVPRELLLQWMERAVAREALDGCDRVTRGLHTEHEAGARAAAVEEDRARATDTVLAAGVRTGEAALLTEHVEEQLARLGAHIVSDTVDAEAVLDHLTHRPGILRAHYHNRSADAAICAAHSRREEACAELMLPRRPRPR